MNIPPETTTSPAEWPELHRQRRAIVVVDVVESVRLMQANEADVIDRWRRFVNEVRTKVLPAHGGRLVKSLGDGLLLEFESVQSAVASALQMQRCVRPLNDGRTAALAMKLRIGVHVAEVVTDDLDIYGAGVNLAARLGSLAAGDEVVVSADVRDELVDGLDVQVEDLGDCFLKHLAAPVRAYRIARVGEGATTVEPAAPLPELRPTIAILPFQVAPGDPVALTIGDALADEVISGLSTGTALNVISRLSTLPFRHRDTTLAEIAKHLGAAYVLSGTLMVSGSRLRVTTELAEASSNSVLWGDSLVGDTRELFNADAPLANTIVAAIGTSIVDNEVRRSTTQPLATLRNYSLLLGAINLMHRSARADFERSRAMLEHLIERERGHAKPHAWLANWHALRFTQGQPGASMDDTALAINHAKRALDRDAHSSLALAIDGVLQLNLLKDFATAGQRFDAALEANPNEALAWLFKSVMHAFAGEAAKAETASARALLLSPLDPMRHYYHSLAATAALGAGQYPRAEELAARSLRANRTHPSTFRALAIAQAMQGHVLDARATIGGMLQLTPGYTVRDFKRLSGFGAGPLRDTFSDALIQAGLQA